MTRIAEKPKKPPTAVSTLVRPSKKSLATPRPPSRADNWSEHQAWLTSVVIHTLIFLSIAILWKQGTHGTSGQSNQRVGITVLDEPPTTSEFFISGEESGSSSARGSASPTVHVSSAADRSGPPISVEMALSELVGTSDGAGTVGILGDGSLGDGLHGTGRGSGTGGTGSKTKTTFMGIEGVGASFVYVLDRSDSMNGYDGAPLRYAKGELISSIASLQEAHQFQVVFYNDAPGTLSSLTGGPSKMLFATDIDKQRATAFVRRITGSGGTEHVPAIKLGLALAPNVLFFMTDADEPSMSSSQMSEIQRLAERNGTTIHTIQFSAGGASGNGNWIRALAEMNRGKYRYVDITTLNRSIEK